MSRFGESVCIIPACTDPNVKLRRTFVRTRKISQIPRRPLVYDLFSCFSDLMVHDHYFAPVSASDQIPIVSAKFFHLHPRPSESLRFPRLEFNPKEAAEMLKSVCLDKWSDKSKPLLASVRGVGGGKTRAVEEIRHVLETDPTLLCLAVTFNCNLEICQEERDFWENFPSIKDQYSFSIVSRMAAVLFDISLPDVCDRFRGQIQPLESFSTEFIRRFVVYAVYRVNTDPRRTGPWKTSFIFLVDESAKLNDVLDPESRRDIHGILRTALLGNPIPNVSTALARRQGCFFESPSRNGE